MKNELKTKKKTVKKQLCELEQRVDLVENEAWQQNSLYKER